MSFRGRMGTVSSRKTACYVHLQTWGSQGSYNCTNVGSIERRSSHPKSSQILKVPINKYGLRQLMDRQTE